MALLQGNGISMTASSNGTSSLHVRVENSDYIGSHLQVRYVCGRVDVVVIFPSSRAVHEMLCRVNCRRFDNRMLQVKKQLRG
jgi:hypothetical protein